MYILGISCFYHEAAVALIKDGILIAAAEEERFSRKKHDFDFPINAINFCITYAGITTKDLDYIVFYEKPFIKFERILISCITNFPFSFGAFTKAMPLWIKQRLWIRSFIQDKLKIEKNILFVEHHKSHAAGSFLVSPFDKAVILTTDGVGEWATTTYGTGFGNDISLEKQIAFPHSLGLFYATVTAYLGFHVNDEEWKVMALASFGKPAYMEQMKRLIDVKDDGSFRLNLKFFAHQYSDRRMFTSALEKLLGQPTRQPKELLTDFYHNVAASLQKKTEEILLKLTKNLYEKYKIENLCIGGGVGLNCVANWKILKESPFKRLFVLPASGDDGGAVGAAFYIYNTILGNERKFQLKNLYLGPEFSDTEIENFLNLNNIKYEKLPTEMLLKKVAKLIFKDNIVGWFQGKMEFGPRALGSRSILANPTNPDMKAIINSKIKFREPFRPFAPTVLKEKAHIYFDMDPDFESPFMLLAPDVRPDKRALLPAITHVDGTARVQTIGREDNPKYYGVIEEFEKLSGVPVVLNTSFNVKGEPIVCTPQDAHSCFLKTDMDVLVLGDNLILKNNNV